METVFHILLWRAKALLIVGHRCMRARHSEIHLCGRSHALLLTRLPTHTHHTCLYVANVGSCVYIYVCVYTYYQYMYVRACIGAVLCGAYT